MLKKNKKLPKSQKGFTIIELMIATSVFSVVLLVVTTGILRLGQSYYKNIISNRTQETVRTVSEDIARTIQLSSDKKISGSSDPNDSNRFCIGNVRYSANLNQKVDLSLDPVPQALTVERLTPSTPCNAASTSSATELLGNQMRLLRFKVEPTDATQKTWKVDIRVAYGDDDLLTAYNNDSTPVDPSNHLSNVSNANCKSGIAGGSFCATAQLDTLVKKRLNTL